MSQTVQNQASFAQSAGATLPPLPLSYGQYEILATYGLPADTTFQLLPHPEDKSCYRIHITRTDAATGKIASDYYKIDPGKKIIAGGSMKNELRDRHTGRVMIADRVLVGLASQYEEITITAADMMGGRSWARAGFTATDHARRFLSDEIYNRAVLLEDVLEDEAYWVLMEKCALEHPDDLFELAFCEDPLRGCEGLFDRALSLTAESYRFCHYDYEEQGFMKPGGLTLSRFLLCGLSYEAHLKFDNPTGMTRFEMYTGMPVCAINAALATQGYQRAPRAPRVTPS